MARTRKPVPQDFAKQAEVLRAKRAITEVDELRFVKKAVDQGVSQDVIADALGTSQATVSRWVAKVSANPKVVQPTVEEIIDRATAHEIDRAQMLNQLRSLRIGYVKADKRPDSAWAALRAATRSGRLTHDEARTLAEDVARRFVARVTGSMELEAQPVPEPGVEKMVKETAARMTADLG